ncbi:MAG TPA: PspC domain-containing protein [Bacteroidales bacterium]|nr:PspC domain-containing protein [Bacteroidales bacterium]
MKKALKINLSGQIFHIDEDAYEKLKIYLDRISSHFSNIEESKEIIADIENRIAEIFNERLKDNSQVITVSDVEEVITIMGRPEDFAEEEGEQEKTGPTGSHHYRRLYRDPDNAVIGGVAAGLSAYFNVDPVVLRILFVVLILVGWGFPVIIYLVLWIAVPKAGTAAQKLEMRGEKVNVSNLEKKIRGEYEDVKENLKKARRSDAGRKTEDFFTEFFRILGVIIVAFVKVIVILIALFFVIIGVGIIASALGIAFFGASIVPFGIFHSIDTEFIDSFLPFVNPTNAGIIAIAGSLVILIPILAVVYGLFKALFRFKAKDRSLGAGAFGLWILALITAVSLIAIEAGNYRESDQVSSSQILEQVPGDTLYVRVNPQMLARIKQDEHFRIDDRRYVMKDDNLYGEVTIDVEKGRSDAYELRMEKGSRGPDEETAASMAEKIAFNYTLQDSLLTVDPWFRAGSGEKWRLQRLDVTIYVPEGKAVHFDKNTGVFLEGVYNLDHYSDYRMAGKTWIMHEEGLESVR